MLHEPIMDDGPRAYCGPTALAAVSGHPISKVKRAIRSAWSGTRAQLRTENGRLYPVRGVSTVALIEAAEKIGLTVKECGRFNGTLGAFCDDRGHMGPFIVHVTGHYVAVSSGMICDTITKHPVPISEYPHLRCRVREWWRF